MKGVVEIELEVSYTLEECWTDAPLWPRSLGVKVTSRRIRTEAGRELTHEELVLKLARRAGVERKAPQKPKRVRKPWKPDPNRAPRPTEILCPCGVMVPVQRKAGPVPRQCPSCRRQSNRDFAKRSVIANPDKNKKWRGANKDKVTKQRQKWRAENKDRTNEYSANARRKAKASQ
jgi:hypothetical protein